MFPNLRAEMARCSPILRTKDMAKALNISEKSVSNKMNGKSKFTLEEAAQIRNVFFPDIGIEFLFAKANNRIPA